MIGPVGILKTACGYFEKQYVTAVTEALKILALPKKGGGGRPMPRFFVGFVGVSQKPYSGITQPK